MKHYAEGFVSGGDLVGVEDVEFYAEGVGGMLYAALLLATSFIHMLNHPQQIAQAMQEIFSY